MCTQIILILPLLSIYLITSFIFLNKRTNILLQYTHHVKLCIGTESKIYYTYIIILICNTNPLHGFNGIDHQHNASNILHYYTLMYVVNLILQIIIILIHQTFVRNGTYHNVQLYYTNIITIIFFLFLYNK